jgi:putative ABC transport system permease protein
VAVTIIQLVLPAFNQLTSIHLNATQFFRPEWLTLVIGGTVMMGAMAGLYPSIYLTRIQPVRLVKGQIVKGSEGSFLRSLLMTFQFTLSIVMIVAIIVNTRQLNFVRTADLGFVKDYIVTVPIPFQKAQSNEAKDSFKEQLLQQRGVEKVAFSRLGPGFGDGTGPVLDIDGEAKTMKLMLCDEDYFDLMGFEIVQGRGFSNEFPADKGDWTRKHRAAGFVLNETAVKEFGIDNPVGKRTYGANDKADYEIVGVVKDFHIRSFHDKVEPLFLAWVANSDVNLTNIKVAPSDIPATLKNIERVWRNVYGHRPFAYKFLDENFDQQYKADQQLAQVIGYFTGIAVIIACLGLFALSSFMVSRRVKEIGVRKVLGASVGTIYSMLSWDFLKWILLAIVIASPVSWFLMKMWLSTFAYHIVLGIDAFVIAALIAVGIALLTVTGQSLKVARANPVDSLKYE